MVWWHRIRLGRISEIITPRGIPTIVAFGRHDALKSKPLRYFFTYVEKRRINPERIFRKTAESLNKKWRTRFRIARDSKNIVGSKNKDVASMGLHEIVGKLIYKDLITGIDRSFRNRLSLGVAVTGKNFEILT